MESSYAANLTRRLPVSAQVNSIPASQLGQASSFYTQRVPNPMAGLLPNNVAKNGPTIPRQDLLLPFPQYTGFTLTNLSIGRQDYHGVQNLVTKRFSRGISTWPARCRRRSSEGSWSGMRRRSWRCCSPTRSR